MSTLQVSNVHLESTANNRIEYAGSNTVNIYAGGTNVLSANSSTMNIPVAGGIAIGNSTVNTAITSTGITQNGLNFRVPKNYIVNPGMRISQENGTSSGTTSGYHPVDQWLLGQDQDGTLTVQQVSSATPGGSENRIRMTVTSADASLAAGQYAIFIHTIEGLRTADLQWGTSNATDVVLRFGFKGPAGTYAVAIRNQDANRSFVREFTISGGDANTDTLQTLTFPGDTSGTWNKGNTLSFSLVFTFATGSTFHTTADAWQAGNYIGTSSTSNGIGTTSDVFEIFDVGLYADPDSTGVAPRFELPHYDTDLQECHRYYWRPSFANNYYYPIIYDTGYSDSRTGVIHPEPMRIAPSISYGGQLVGHHGNAADVITPTPTSTYFEWNGANSRDGAIFELITTAFNARM